jgi:hypothetical protein
MRVSWRQRGRDLKFRFDPEPGDLPTNEPVRMFRHGFTAQMPESWDVDRAHPDLLATSAFLAVRPFVGEQITFPVGISDRLASALPIPAGPIDPGLAPRPLPSDGVPALAYSGGVDSTAALALLPPSAEAVHLLRFTPPLLAAGGSIRRLLVPRRRRLHLKYRPEAALFAVEGIRRLGRTAHVVPCDIEFMGLPIGFPVDIANAVPALLMADMRAYDSIAFGTVMESAYSVGRVRFADYARRQHYLQYGRLLDAIGMPLHQVTAGISEVGTTRIVSVSPYAEVAQSCVRGRPGEPCLNCYKCFRKTLLAAAVSGEEIDARLADRLVRIPEAQVQMRRQWMKHENVVAYATRHYHGDHRVLRLLRRRVWGSNFPVRWMERWYPPAAELLPAHRRAEATAAIRQALPPMSPAQQATAEAWNLAPILATPAYRRRRARLIAALEECS